MLKVIELDAPAKDRDTVIYVAAVNGEKVAVTEDEMIEMIRAKHARTLGRRTAKAATPAKSSESQPDFDQHATLNLHDDAI